MSDVPQLDPAVANEQVGAGALLLDVREPFEWEAGRAPAAVHIPLGTLPDALLGLSSAQPIVVVCRSGGRSQQAAAFLAERGYTASNLVGGMRAWAAAGLPMVADGAADPVVA